eukprot:m.193116 g.193116  ORF g.193116 m.193116 type:complete len:169 (+) comp18284_c0_seq1:1695-2201(+)
MGTFVVHRLFVWFASSCLVCLLPLNKKAACTRRKRDQQYLPPPPDKWEVPRDRLTMQQELGKGAFGKVFSAELLMAQEKPRDVAVKTCNLIDRDQLSDFLQELELMKAMSEGAHPNVILLMGVCTQERPLYGIMELADQGDLLSYVRVCQGGATCNGGQWGCPFYLCS